MAGREAAARAGALPWWCYRPVMPQLASSCNTTQEPDSDTKCMSTHVCASGTHFYPGVAIRNKMKDTADTGAVIVHDAQTCGIGGERTGGGLTCGRFMKQNTECSCAQEALNTAPGLDLASHTMPEWLPSSAVGPLVYKSVVSQLGAHCGGHLALQSTAARHKICGIHLSLRILRY